MNTRYYVARRVNLECPNVGGGGREVFTFEKDPQFKAYSTNIAAKRAFMEAFTDGGCNHLDDEWVRWAFDMYSRRSRSVKILREKSVK